MPRFHVFAGGLLTLPNDLMTLPSAVERFQEYRDRAEAAGRRTIISLHSSRGKGPHGTTGKRLRRFEI